MAGTVKGMAAVRVMVAWALERVPTSGLTAMIVPAASLDFCSITSTFWNPSDCKRAKASSVPFPITSGMVRAQETSITTSLPASALTPAPGRDPSTIPSTSSDFTSTWDTAKPASSSLSVASWALSPTTSGTCLPPQSSKE